MNQATAQNGNEQPPRRLPGQVAARNEGQQHGHRDQHHQPQRHDLEMRLVEIHDHVEHHEVVEGDEGRRAESQHRGHEQRGPRFLAEQINQRAQSEHELRKDRDVHRGRQSGGQVQTEHKNQRPGHDHPRAGRDAAGKHFQGRIADEPHHQEQRQSAHPRRRMLDGMKIRPAPQRPG